MSEVVLLSDVRVQHQKIERQRELLMSCLLCLNEAVEYCNQEILSKSKPHSGSIAATILLLVRDSINDDRALASVYLTRLNNGVAIDEEKLNKLLGVEWSGHYKSMFPET